MRGAVPRNTTGIHTLPSGYLAVTGEVIQPSAHNAPLEDLSNEITASLSRRGNGAMQAPLDMGGFKITNAAAGSSSTDGVIFSQLQSSVDAALALILPAGMQMMYHGTTAPTGWLVCNGAAVSRTTYAALFAVISTRYGAGDGVTTFNLPDDITNEYFYRAWNSGVRSIGSTQTDDLKSHSHTATTTITDPGHAHGFNDSFRDGANGTGSFAQGTPSANTTSIAFTGIAASTTVNSFGGSETRPKNRALLPIIKF